MTYLTNKLQFGKAITGHFYLYNTILVLLSSVLLFLGFSRLTCSKKSNKIINVISPLTFGVYLIHDHSLLRGILWKGILRVNQYINSNFFIVNCMLITIGIFAFSLIVELMRQKIFKIILRLNFLNKYKYKLRLLNDKYNAFFINHSLNR